MLLNAKEVSELLDLSISTSYRCIRELNKELKEQGYLVRTGKVNERYLKKRYGLLEDEKN